MTRFQLPLAALFLLVLGRFAHADAFLESLNGEWSGGGWARQETGAVREAVRCRLSFHWNEGTKTVQVSGKCVGGSVQSKVSADLRSLGNGRYRATWTAAGKRLDHMSGRLSGSSLLFRWSYDEAQSGKIATGDLRLTLSGRTLTMTTRQTGPQSGGLGQLDLRRN